MTERRGFVLRVKPDRIDEYVEAHRHVWPEMLEALRAAGIRNYTIFRAGNEMFGYFESDDLEAAAAYRRSQRAVAGRDGGTAGGACAGRRPATSRGSFPTRVSRAVDEYQTRA